MLRWGALLLLGLTRFCFAEFRGGTVMWKPNASSPLKVDFTFRVAFTRSHPGGSYYCDQQTISSQSLLGSAGQGWEARQCDGRSVCREYSMQDARYFCSEFSKFQDWSEGENSFAYQFANTGPWHVRYSSCCWSGFSGAGNFSLATTLNLTTRSDTGQINSSPISASLPVIRLLPNCPRVIKFPREDPDGDTVRCRLANSDESAGNYGNIPYSSLNEAECSFSFYGAPGVSASTRAVALTLQDYAPGSRDKWPLSNVGLQFLLEILNVSSSCDRKPVFTDATPSDGLCVPVAVGSAFDTRVEVKHTDPSERIVEIQIVAPRGVSLSGLHYSKDDSGHQTYYRRVSWNPTASQVGQNLLCFAALDATGVQSEMRCVTLLVGSYASPKPVLGNRFPKNPASHKGSGYTSFNISFDHKIQKPQRAAFIHVFLNEHEVFKVNTLLPDVTIGNDRTTLHFRLPDVVLSMRGTYHILMDSGAVVGIGCSSGGLPTPGISSSNDWSFFTVGVCGEGFYIGPPGFSNCIDVNECDTADSVPSNVSLSSGVNTFVLHSPNNCSHDCVNTQGTFTCTCPQGFVLDEAERTCSDKNECQKNNGGCSHSCVNQPGSFYCVCPAGLLLGSDKATCRDPGVVVKCSENLMQVQLNRAHFSKLDPALLHLKFASCKATTSASHITFKTPLNGCGTTYSENATTVTFWNEIRGDNKVIDGVVTRMNDFSVSIHCTFSRKEVVALSFDPRSVAFGAEGGGYGNLTFGMALYKTEEYSQAYTSRDYPITVPLGDRIFLEYHVQSSSAELMVFAERCKATSDGDALSWPTYDFIRDGCAQDTTVIYKYKPGNKQRFSIEAFRFIESYETVYLHCELLACHQDTSDSRCAQGCTRNKRKRRSTDIKRGTDGTSTYRVSAGPIKLTQDNTAGDTGKRKAVVIGGSVAGGGVGLILVVVGVALAAKYRLMRLFTNRNKVANRYTNGSSSQTALFQQTEEEDALQIEDLEPEALQILNFDPEAQQTGFEPEAQQTEDIEPEVQQTEGVEPEAQQTEHIEPEAQQTEHIEPEAQQTEHIEPEAQQTVGVEPEAQQTEDIEPEAQQTEHIEPEAQQTEEFEPEAQQTEGIEPEAQQTEDFEPEAQQTEGIEPEAQQTEDFEPEAQQTEGIEPEAQQTEDFEPEAQQTEGIEPEAQQTEDFEPEAQQTEEVEPEAMQIEDVE